METEKDKMLRCWQCYKIRALIELSEPEQEESENNERKKIRVTSVFIFSFSKVF